MLLGVSYFVQRHRFMAVDSAVRRLMMTCAPGQPIVHNETRAEQHR
ncbi:hypothetical protein [Lysobacter gummosus]